MNVVNKIVTEWAFRCKKGYPDMNNPDDMKILKEIYSEYGIVMEEQKDQTINTSPDFKILGLPQEDILIIESIYNTLSNKERDNFDKNYRKSTLEEYINNPVSVSQPFKKFFQASHKKGRGRGEFLPLLAIVGAKSGGIQDKDVIVGSKVLEVKELAKNQFLTGKSGTIRRSALATSIETFCKYLEALEITPGAMPDVDFVLDYYNGKYISGNLSNKFVNTLKQVSKKLSTLDVKKVEKNSEYVKIGEKRYEIIKKEQGYGKGDSITLGRELPPTELAASKLENHPITEDPEIIDKQYEEVIDKYLSTVDYFCIYPEGVDTPRVYTSSQLKDKLRTGYISTVQGNLRLLIN
jgi:hypothetical protein